MSISEPPPLDGVLAKPPDRLVIREPTPGMCYGAGQRGQSGWVSRGRPGGVAALGSSSPEALALARK